MRINKLYGINRFLIGIVFVLLSMIIFLERKHNLESHQMRKKIESLVTKDDVLLANYFKQTPSDGIQLEDAQAAIFKEYLKKNDNKKLCLRIKEDHCSSCVDNVLELLAIKSKELGSDNVIIIATEETERYVAAFLLSRGLELGIICIEDLNFPIEQYAVPYLFRIDNSMKAYSFFIPSRKLPHFSDSYLKIVSEGL